jgi:ketosteroid isomerase-like protein
MTAKGRPYINRYVYRLDMRDGRICRLREYCNPVTVAVAFEMPMPRW